MSKYKQGRSATVTPIKQENLHGLVFMRLLMGSNWLASGGEYGVFDVLSGSGENTVEGRSINGSTISILEGIHEALYRCGDLKNYDGRYRISLFAADIRKEAITSLELILNNKQPLIHTSVIDNKVEDTIKQIYDWLAENKKRRAIVFVDPTGPRSFPYKEIKRLMVRFKSRVDLIIHVSATAMKRINGCVQAQKNLGWLLGAFNDVFIDGLYMHGDCWIREPIDGDPHQWTMLTYWSCKAPDYDWSSKHFVKLKSERGQQAVYKYSYTRKGAA